MPLCVTIMSGRVYNHLVKCTIDLGNLPDSIKALDVTTNALSGTVRVPEQMYHKFI